MNTSNFHKANTLKRTSNALWAAAVAAIAIVVGISFDSVPPTPGGHAPVPIEAHADAPGVPASTFARPRADLSLADKQTNDNEAVPDNAPVADVEVIAGPGGSYVVHKIESESLYDRLGLRVGDVIHDIETLNDLQFPRSLEHAMRYGEFRLAVYRDGVLTLLRHP